MSDGNGGHFRPGADDRAHGQTDYNAMIAVFWLNDVDCMRSNVENVSKLYVALNDQQMQEG